MIDGPVEYIALKWPTDVCRFLITTRLAHFSLSFKKLRIANEIITSLESDGYIVIDQD